MDSMRSLNTSLPKASPYKQPPEQLLQAFRTAALSVTNLYKSAISDQNQARQAGYQDAIEDLLNFLDRENLGLDDGEGWKVRQWATERADGTAAMASETEEEKGDSEQRDRSCSPLVVRKDQPAPDTSRHISPSITTSRQHNTNEQPLQQQSLRSDDHSTTAPITVSPEQESISDSSKPPIFAFTAGPQFISTPSSDVDMQTSDNSTATSSLNDGSLVGVPMLSRTPRGSVRHGNNSRHPTRSSTRESYSTPGSKRKLTFPDFFDISGLNGRDFFGGGKRGRFT
jgi:hypothetical protein